MRYYNTVFLEGRQGNPRQDIELGLAEAYDYASQVMTENMLHAEAEEGINAFLNKRKQNPLSPSGGEG